MSNMNLQIFARRAPPGDRVGASLVAVSSRHGAGQGQGRRVSRQLHAAYFVAVESGFFKEQNIETRWCA